MNERPTDRRWFITLIGSAIGATMAGCRTSVPSPEEVARLLELRDEERGWVAELSVEEVQRLHAGLSDPAGPTAAAARILAKVLAPRTRISSFVHYPRIGDIRTVCDGLIRE